MISGLFSFGSDGETWAAGGGKHRKSPQKCLWKINFKWKRVVVIFLLILSSFVQLPHTETRTRCTRDPARHTTHTRRIRMLWTFMKMFLHKCILRTCTSHNAISISCESHNRDNSDCDANILMFTFRWWIELLLAAAATLAIIKSNKRISALHDAEAYAYRHFLSAVHSCSHTHVHDSSLCFSRSKARNVRNSVRECRWVMGWNGADVKNSFRFCLLSFHCIFP